MNANGNVIMLTLSGKNYYFNNMQISVSNRIETTPLIGGGCIRVRAGGTPETIILKARISHGDIFRYEDLLKSLAEGVISGLKINTLSYSGYTLASGKIICSEQQALADCEIVLTEVDE